MTEYLDKDTAIEKQGFHPLYILAVLYVICVYLFPIIYLGVNVDESDENNINMLPLLILLVFGLINLIVVIAGRNKIDRIQLLNCAVIIKYALIPFYILGGLCIAIAILLMFTPVVIMAFVGPAVAVTFSTLGWIAMVGAAPYSIAYIVKSCKQGVHGRVLSVAAGICQFFFTVDVISIMILALKEKRCVKITAALLCILIVAVIISVICLIALIAGAVIG